MNTLQTVRTLRHYKLHATDGAIGSIEDLYFDDTSWTVRYLVVNTGSWLLGRRVLLTPTTISTLDEYAKTIHIDLTQEQIKHSPPIDSDQPVSRRYELNYHQYYDWLPYWEPGFSLGLPLTDEPIIPAELEATDQALEQVHLRSTEEVSGYQVTVHDGNTGHVKDFIVDTQSWHIRYLEIDTRDWWPGKHIIINPAWIQRIFWRDRSVALDLTVDAIKSAPAFDPSKIISRDYETQLFNHYGRAHYWQTENTS